ncbi:MAG: hypothetical protein ABSG46_03710 [Candidatus Binataceae bacterium]|jgi:hypothetical protein
MSGKNGPDELTLEDFDIVADELTANYFSGVMGSYLSCVFMNSEYVQPEPKGAESKKKKHKRGRNTKSGCFARIDGAATTRHRVCVALFPANPQHTWYIDLKFRCSQVKTY